MPLKEPPPPSGLSRRLPTSKPTDADAVRAFLEPGTPPPGEAPAAAVVEEPARAAARPSPGLYAARTFRLRADHIDSLKRHKDAYNALRRLPTAPLTMDELGRIIVAHFLKHGDVQALIDELRPLSS